MSQNPTPSLLFVSRLVAGAGIVLDPANGTGIVTISSTSESAQDATTNIPPSGDGFLTAAGMVGGVITRSGAPAAFTDTTATAAAIVSAIPNATAGQAFYLSVVNTTAFPETVAAGV